MVHVMKSWVIRFFFILSVNQLYSSIPIELTGNIFFSSDYLMHGIVTIENKSDVEELIANMIKKYAEIGFPFCRIYPEIIYEDNRVEKIILKIKEGERIIITDYLFNVEGKTARGAVKKIAKLETNTYFCSKELEKSKRNMLNTDVFEDVDYNIIHREDMYYVLFNLIERKSDYITALGSLGENEINFSISFYSLNLLGTLRKLQFLYEYRKLFSIEFTEPILIYPAELQGNFSLWSYDSVRLIQFNGKFSAPLHEHLKVSLMSGIEAVSYSGNDTTLRGHTDNLLGIGLDANIGSSTWQCKQIFNFDYLFRQHDRWRIQYDGKFEVKNINISPHYYMVRTDSFEYFDYYRMGGTKNLRGYLEEEFITDDVKWLNLEYKRFFIFPVFDIGIIDNDIKFSYGFGIEAKSDFAHTAFIIAWPRDGTWRDGKIHLMLEKGF
jgi:outer membrane protein assembly factor BamA